MPTHTYLTVTCVCKRETYLRVQAFETGKMTSIDEFINGGLFFVNTVHRKLPHGPEGISAVICRALMIGLVVPCSYCKNAGEGERQEGWEGRGVLQKLKNKGKKCAM